MAVECGFEGDVLIYSYEYAGAQKLLLRSTRNVRAFAYRQISGDITAEPQIEFKLLILDTTSHSTTNDNSKSLQGLALRHHASTTSEPSRRASRSDLHVSRE